MIFWFSWVPALYPLFLRPWRHGKAKLSSRLPSPMLAAGTWDQIACKLSHAAWRTPPVQHPQILCVSAALSTAGSATARAVTGEGKSQELCCPPGCREISTFLSSLRQRARREKSFLKERCQRNCCVALRLQVSLWALLGFPHIVLLKARPGGDGFQTLKVPRCGCTVSGLNAKPRFCVCGVTSKSHSDHIWPL